jgi:hypothetical protein
MHPSSNKTIGTNAANAAVRANCLGCALCLCFTISRLFISRVARTLCHYLTMHAQLSAVKYQLEKGKVLCRFHCGNSGGGRVAQS